MNDQHTNDASAEYDEAYYQGYCAEFGLAYERNEIWLRQFANISENIVRSLAPRRVLDAGCAFGFLVEALRDRGVEAYGVDVSEYAIAQVRPDMARYCQVGSLTQPLEGRYDLVTCIEVLEHIPPDIAPLAIDSICAITDKILFSSSPDDFDEPTHVNLNPPIAWLRMFAERGFAPDPRHEAGDYLTPHAVLLRRADGPIDDTLLVLHARKQMLANDVARAKGKLVRAERANAQSLAEERERVHTANLAYEEASANVRTLAQRAEDLAAELERLRGERDIILRSASWRVTAPLRAVRSRLTRLLPFLPNAVPHVAADRLVFECPPSGPARLRIRDAGPVAADLAVIAYRPDGPRALPIRSREVAEGYRIIHFAVPDHTSRLAVRVTRGEVDSVALVHTSDAWAIAGIAREQLATVGFRGLPALVRKAVRLARDGHLMERVSAATGSDGEIDYQTFLALHDVQDAEGLGRAREQSASLLYQPVVSIVMPTYRSNLDLLEQAIASIRRQTYESWELCIADDASDDRDLDAFLRKQAAQDERIKVVFRPENGHISAASNSALALATGDFVALMDHDDEIHPCALSVIVNALNADPTLDILYSDEDKIDGKGRRYDPYFKPDWNPDLLLSQNYVSHLGVYRRTLLEEIGGFRTGVEGSQDYDLVLRATERTNRVTRLPHVLYHWRAVEGSTALAASEKSYAFERSERALADAVARRELNAIVGETGFGAYHRVRFHLPASAPKISIIVPTRDRADLLEVSTHGVLEKTRYVNFELIVVDNGSSDPATTRLFDRLKQDARVRVLSYDKPFNYSAINNFAVEHTSGAILCFLNNDIEVIDEGWLEEMASHACRPEIGAVGARLLYPDGRVQHDGIIVGMGGVAGYAHPFIDKSDPARFGRSRLVQNYSAVTAAALVVRRDVFDEIGGFDAEHLPVSFNDVDLCLRILEAGYRNLYTPFAELVHHESVSRGSDLAPDKIARFEREIGYMRRRWPSIINDDPAYNPNLSLRNELSFRLDSSRHNPFPWTPAVPGAERT